MPHCRSALPPPGVSGDDWATAVYAATIVAGTSAIVARRSSGVPCSAYGLPTISNITGAITANSSTPLDATAPSIAKNRRVRPYRRVGSLLADAATYGPSSMVIKTSTAVTRDQEIAKYALASAPIRDTTISGSSSGASALTT